MADFLGYKSPYFSGIINGKEKLSDSFLKTISDKLNINISWILTGNGPMLAPSKFEANASVADSSLEYINVPIVPVHAQCGSLAGYGDPEYIKTLPTMPVVIDKAFPGKHLVFVADGDSMDDASAKAICDGDHVLGREIDRDLWRYNLHFDQWYYVIVHRTEGIAIKEITALDEHGNITCHSLNPLFPDYTVNLDEVARLFQVTAIVKRSMRH